MDKIEMKESTASSLEESLDDMSTTNQTRTFHVQFDNWMWRKATIFDSDEKTQLYRVECHLRNPQLIIRSVSDETQSNTVTSEARFHCLASRIDINLRGQDIEIASRGMLKDGYTYASPALNGAKVTWRSKNKWGYFSLVCLDETAMPIAHISFHCWKITKAATIELIGEKFVREGSGMDEIVSTGLAILQQRLSNYSATYGAAALTSAGSAA